MRKSDFTLPTLDDLFSTQAERDDAKLERVRNIPLAELHPFKGQGLLYRRAATSEVGGDRLMLGRTDDFLSEKVKEHGIARFGKRKEPVIGLITGS